MSWVSSLFGGSKPQYQDPAASAQPYYEQMPQYIQSYTTPYINYGLQAGQQNASQFSQMAMDPANYYNDLYSTYEPSDYYQYQSDQMAKTASNTAAAGGFSGTESDIQKQTEQQNALLDADWQQYLNNVLGIQSTGLQGNQQLYNTGANESNIALDDYMNMLNSQAGLAYNSTQGQNAYNANMYNQQMGSLGALGGMAAYATPSIASAADDMYWDSILGLGMFG